MNVRTSVIVRRVLGALALALVTAVVVASQAWAHQPHFEDRDFSVQQPFHVSDPTVSMAVYATLSSEDDVDVFAFSAKAGQEIHVGLLVPDIAGQTAFTPMSALVGPGLPADEIASQVGMSADDGAILLSGEVAEQAVFEEPFTRTRYWKRQDSRLTMPEDGNYRVAVWHGDGRLGRYTFVIGEREVLGGDPLFGPKLRAFWTPVSAATQDSIVDDPRARAEHRVHGDPHDRFKWWLEHIARSLLEFFAPWMPRT